MARSTTKFICRSCGGVQPRWMGKCPDCGQWSSLEEYRVPDGADEDPHRGAGVGALPSEVGRTGGIAAAVAQPITEVTETGLTRLPTGIGELDRVLGSSGPAGSALESEVNDAQHTLTTKIPTPAHQTSDIRHHTSTSGLVPGSVVLLGGDPGIGKSTLMLQAADRLAANNTRVLYVTTEESAAQTRLRRLALGAVSPELFVLADTNLARVVEQARRVNPAVMVIDSIQMLYKGDLPAAPGSVAQLRSCCQELVYLAKASGVAIFLVGHVTKQGQLAGPRLLEHMVDTVLYFEGDRYHHHRIVRAIKNRFGTTLEVGLFEMTDSGLKEVADGAGILSAEYRPMAGSVVCPVLQGSRCLLVEIQALTATGFLGAAKRKVSGLDANRLAMLIAVLEKRGGLRLADQDVFVSSVGGMKVIEPAADLAIAVAIAGAHLNRQLAQGVCAVGEIGLGGEVRGVSLLDQRIIEATRLGFTQIICPRTKSRAPGNTRLIPVNKVSEAIEVLA